MNLECVTRAIPTACPSLSAETGGVDGSGHRRAARHEGKAVPSEVGERGGGCTVFHHPRRSQSSHDTIGGSTQEVVRTPSSLDAFFHNVTLKAGEGGAEKGLGGEGAQEQALRGAGGNHPKAPAGAETRRARCVRHGST